MFHDEGKLPRLDDERRAAAARLGERIHNRTASCAVVGLGRVGTMQASLLLDAGFRVSGFDTDPAAVNAFRDTMRERGAGAPEGTFSSSENVLAAAEIVVVCVRVAIDEHGAPDLSALLATANALSRQCTGPVLVLIVTTVVVGTTLQFATEWLAPKPGAHWFVAGSPERLATHQSMTEVFATPRLVAGVDALAADLGEAFVATLCAQVVRVSRPEICELSKLLENAFRTQCIALVGELTRTAHALGLSAAEVCEAAATKPFGYFPFHPGPGIGGHCLPNDLRLLQASCRKAQEPSALLETVAQVIDHMPRTTVRRLERLMRNRTLQQATVLIVGVGFKPGAEDPAASPAMTVMEQLLEAGATVSYLDDWAAAVEVRGERIERVAADQMSSRRFDAVVVISGAQQVTIQQLEAVSDLVLDAGGAQVMSGDRQRMIRL